MNMIRTLAIALMMLPLAAIQGMAQDYLLRAGDVVQIEVLEDGNLNRTAIVLPDGQISVPQAGTIRAAGRSLAQIQAELTDRFAVNFANRPTVFVTLNSLAERVRTTSAPRTLGVYIVGQVATSGRLDVAPGTTVLQAIAMAGGLSPFAAKKRIQLRRVDKSGTERVYPLDFDAIERGVAGGGAMKLGSGDVIVVPQRKLFE